jgi:hypothetical protein
MSAPFGIEIGAGLDSLQIQQDIGGNKYKVQPPKPHPGFSDYYVQHSPTYGVVWVKAISPPFEADAYGTNLRAALERNSGQLQGRYGPPRKVDVIAYDALWPDPRDWVMSMLQNERSFFHVWERTRIAPFPVDLNTVFLGVLPHSSSDSSVIVEYSSTDFDAAEREADTNLSDLL